MGEKIRRRNTRQRQVVLEELRRVAWHPTAAELYETARRRLPKLSLGTVYRNLELLATDGAIQKLEISGTESRFDGNLEQHHHVRCACCGRVDDLHGIPSDLVGNRFKTWSGYEILGYRLEFVGICPACKKATTEEDTRDTPREGE